jgi:autotransporter translocation and assembly factor TamB
MLFEKPAADMSSGEAITLLTVMGKLSGRRGFDIMDKVKTVFGLDMIEIKRNSNTETGNQYNSVSIGKSLGKVKVSLDQGAEKDTTKVVLESDIATNTKVNVDMTGKNNFGAGVAWHKRY